MSDPDTPAAGEAYACHSTRCYDRLFFRVHPTFGIRCLTGPAGVNAMAARTETPPTVDVALDIRAMPRTVMDAFFDASALDMWWPAARSVTTPRLLGPYVIEW